jgi:acetyl esterase/lipase
MTSSKIEGISSASVARRLVVVATALLALLACVPARVGAADGAPARYLDQAFGSVDVQSNLVYGRAPLPSGEEQDLKLDLYQPAGDRFNARPVVIYAHGGAFTKGNKESGHDWPYTDDFARRGFVSASIDYRLDGSETDATDDMQAAVRWFKAHADEYRIDPGRITVIGSSSGAVMALSTAFAPEDPGDSGNPGYPSNVAAALSISGDSEHPDTITPGDPPIAMFHAMDDATIPYAAAEATCQDTQAQGNVCEMYAYPQGGHPPPFAIANRADIVQKSSDFLCRRILRPGACDPSKADTTPPATTDDVPATYQPGPVTVTLSASDAGGSGVYRTYYTTGANPPDPTTASAVYDPSAKPVLGDGERIKYFSSDLDGNVEPVESSPAAMVDTSAPTSAASAAATTESPTIPVRYAADDAGSGLERVELYVKRPGDSGYSLAATDFSPATSDHLFSYGADAGEGDYAFYTVAYDAVGNAEAAPADPDAVSTFDRPPPQAVTLLAKTLTATQGGVVTAPLENPNRFGVSGATRLTAVGKRHVGLGKAQSFSIAAGKDATVKIVLSDDARKLLADRGKLPVRVALSTEGPGGTTGSARTVVLKAPTARTSSRGSPS